MKVWNDENIQKLLEQGEPWDDTDLSTKQKEELEAYKFLFAELKKEPAGSLPRNFSKNVVSQLQNEGNRAANFKFYLLVVTLLIGTLVLFYLLMLYNEGRVIPPIFYAITSYRWALLFCLVGLTLIQYLDYKLVKAVGRTSHF